MQLSNILHKAGLSSLEKDTFITGMAEDSRKVEKGCLFASLPSHSISSEARLGYIKEAIAKGAGALLVSSGIELEGISVPVIYHPSPRTIWGHVVSCYYDNLSPTTQHVVAVTGTNGKSSVVHILQHLWHASSLKSASIGTLGIQSPFFTPHASLYSGLTTPDSITLHASLHALSAQNITHVALEASSHGLDQYRLNGVKLTAAAFINLTQDHLDYHHTMEAYFTTKMRLFSEILPKYKTAVIAVDTPYYKRASALCKARHHTIVDYGWKAQALKLIKALPCKEKPGQNVTVEIYGKSYNFFLPLFGNFQVLNSLCALGLFLSESNDSIEHALESLASLPSIPGRVELAGIHPSSNALIFIDYAHTPDALKQLLTSLRPHTMGALHVVFGCGGNRDLTKREIMGSIAQEYADVIIVTDDNPRYEDPAVIRRSILKNCPKAKEIGSRKEAIFYAITQLKPKDILVIAGKGHEKMQIVEGRTLPFDEKTIIQEALASL